MRDSEEALEWDLSDALGRVVWNPSEHRFPVSATVVGTAQAFRDGGTAWFRETAIPLLAYLALRLFELRNASTEPSFLITVLPGQLVIVSMAVIGVRCCQFNALGPASLPRAWGLSWSWRETRFLGWIWVMFVVGPLAVLAVAYVMNTLGGGRPLLVLLAIAAYYVFVRLSLVFPASAVGPRLKLKDSWRLTRANGRRLALLPALALIPAMLLMWLARNLAASLGREDQFVRGQIMYDVPFAVTGLLIWVAAALLLARAFAWFVPKDV
jgi:hypothetical protein